MQRKSLKPAEVVVSVGWWTNEAACQSGHGHSTAKTFFYLLKVMMLTGKQTDDNDCLARVSFRYRSVVGIRIVRVGVVHHNAWSRAVAAAAVNGIVSSIDWTRFPRPRLLCRRGGALLWEPDC